MKTKPILLVAGEPNSIFLEILFKTLKSQKFKDPLILIASYKLLKLQMKKLRFDRTVKILDLNKLKNYKLTNKKINLINVDYETNKAFDKISNKSKIYIQNSFEVATSILKSRYTNKLINGPISKKHFLNKKFLGITEYLANRLIKKNLLC